jgi:hypothetical protein
MTDPTPQLDRLIARLSLLIRTATQALEAEPDRVEAWEQEVSAQIRRYHTAAYLAGAGSQEVSPAARRAIDAYVSTQLDFLHRFAVEIAEADDWQAGWEARAAMYAQSIKAPYWTGKVKLLPLPAMPGDGTTQCLTNCGCQWDVAPLDGVGNYDAYWRRGKNDSCQTCVQREAEWAPLEIRGGELV